MIGWKPKSHSEAVASVRYRCLMPLAALQQQGISVELFDSSHLEQYCAVIFSKLYDQSNIKIAKKLKKRGATVVLDICDNHLYNPRGLPKYQMVRQNLLEMIELSDHVVCSTEALADTLVAEAKLTTRPDVIGDSIERLPGVKRPTPSEGKATCELLWFGHYGSPNAEGGMLDLLNITPHLIEFASQHSAELHVVSNNRAMYDEAIAPLAIPSRYSEWHYDSFARSLSAADAVLLPISINPFSVCKTNNRVVTALNAGVPVIADQIPSYSEFASFVVLDDWNKGFEQLATNRQRLHEMAQAGQSYVQKEWSIDKIAAQWQRLLKQL